MANRRGCRLGIVEATAIWAHHLKACRVRSSGAGVDAGSLKPRSFGRASKGESIESQGRGC
eukprot:1679872-Lingulodinium_polyedra.AAC.1